VQHYSEVNFENKDAKL